MSAECKRLRKPHEAGPDCTCAPGTCALGVAEGLCLNCYERPGTIRWGDALSITHGGGVMWCEVCVLRKQIEHAEERATALHDLRKRLFELTGEGEPPVCPPTIRGLVEYAKEVGFVYVHGAEGPPVAFVIPAQGWWAENLPDVPDEPGDTSREEFERAWAHDHVDLEGRVP